MVTTESYVTEELILGLMLEGIDPVQVLGLDEASLAGEHLIVEILDQDKFVEANECPEVTNPMLFQKANRPTSDGLLSYELFGITQEERANIFGYISLRQKFIQPYYYKIWLKIDRNLRGCVYETANYKIDDEGYLIPDDNGETGIEFLINNASKLNFKKTKKDSFLKALIDGRDKGKLFTDKMIVIPPYYRDVSTGESGKVGVGEINKLYIALLNSVRALSETALYGLSLSGGTKGRIQDILMQIYNWFTVGESIIGGEHTGSGIFKKFGIMRRATMGKTTDNAARLVISAPNINVNSQKDLMVDLNYSSIPLSAALVTAYPFIIYELNRWFSNEFGGKTKYPIYDEKTKTTRYIELLNPMIEFSNDRFDAEINEFVHGYSNRFKPVKVPNKEGLDINLRFKGYQITTEQYAKGIRETGAPVERDLTWVDILYWCACRATKDKAAIISRYPMRYESWHLYSNIELKNCS